MLVGTLSEEMAKSLLASRSGDDESARDASGTARFWITDGLLMKYVVDVPGTIPNDDGRRELWRRTTVEVKEIGTAKIDLPHGGARL